MLSKVVGTVIVLAILLGSLQNCDLAFKYDSLMVGLYKPVNCTLSDSEWRVYYTAEFPEKFSDIHISYRTYD